MQNIAPASVWGQPDLREWPGESVGCSSPLCPAAQSSVVQGKLWVESGGHPGQRFLKSQGLWIGVVEISSLNPEKSAF